MGFIVKAILMMGKEKPAPGCLTPASYCECGDNDHRAPASRTWLPNSSNHQRKYEGLFVCPISLMDQRDKAVRRFTLNILFDYLRPDQAAKLFTRVLADLQGYNESRWSAESVKVSLSQLSTLAPGDFTTVVRQT